MELAEGIRRIGFERWYERQLMEAHLYLVTTFLCLILVTALLEGLSLRAGGGVEPFARLFGVLAGGYVGVWALARYGELLRFAENAAGQSVCGQCAAYGRLELSGRDAQRTMNRGRRREAGSPPLGVRCRKCGHEWVIE